MDFNRLYENWIKPTDRYRLSQMLEDKGWTNIGSGAFGDVYGRSDKNYVLKLYNDKGYRSFLEFIESEQGNPNVVMVKRIVFKDENVKGSTYSRYGELVALEKLKPFPYGSMWAKVISLLWGFRPDIIGHNKDTLIMHIRNHLKSEVEYYKSKVRDNPSSYSVRDDLKDAMKTQKAFEIILTRYKNLVETIFRLKEYINKNNLNVNFDLHSGNFMIRPSTGQVVITDPLT